MIMFLEQQIRMISEGSCDTEDWSNDAENSTLPPQKEMAFKILKYKYLILKVFMKHLDHYHFLLL